MDNHSSTELFTVTWDLYTYQCWWMREQIVRIRMHSSRMRTARGEGGGTWSWGVYLIPGGCTWSREVYLAPGGVSGPGGCTWSWEGTWSGGGCTWPQGGLPSPGGVPGPGGGYLVRGVPGPGGRVYLVPGWYQPRYPPLDRITDARENITLPQLRCGR